MQRSGIFLWSYNACKPKFNKNETITRGGTKNQKGMIRIPWMTTPHDRYTQKDRKFAQRRRFRKWEKCIKNEISTKGFYELPRYERERERERFCIKNEDPFDKVLPKSKYKLGKVRQKERERIENKTGPDLCVSHNGGKRTRAFVNKHNFIVFIYYI